MTYKHLLILICASFTTHANAKDKTQQDITSIKHAISQAVTQFEKTKREHWSFDVSRYENEEGDVTSSIEKFSPNLDVKNQWSLLSINGNKPTSAEVEKFIERKVAQAQKQQNGANYSMKLRELIQQSTLTFEGENNLVAELSFRVKLPKLGEDAEQKLQGQLSYNKQQEFIEEIVITNTAEFSPMFSATISEFKLTFTFVKIDNAILPNQQNLQMKGRFAFFTEIDEVSSDTYSNYQYVPLTSANNVIATP